MIQADNISSKVKLSLWMRKGIFLFFLSSVFFLLYFTLLNGQEWIIGQFIDWELAGEMLAVLISMGISMFGYFLITSYFFHAGQARLFSAVYQEVKEKGGIFCFTTAIYLSLTALGLLLFFIPGILIALFGIFYPFVLFHNKGKGLESIKLSARIVKTCFFQVLFYYILFYLLFIIIGTPFTMVWPENSVIGEAIAGALVVPIEAVFYYKLYIKASFK